VKIRDQQQKQQQCTQQQTESTTTTTISTNTWSSRSDCELVSTGAAKSGSSTSWRLTSSDESCTASAGLSMVGWLGTASQSISAVSCAVVGRSAWKQRSTVSL